MGTIVRDLRFAARSLAKRPGSAIIAVVAFGLGIGLSTTMFSIVYGVFFRGLDVPEPDRLVLVYRNNPSENIRRMWVPQHDMYDWREQQGSFVGLAGYSTGTMNLSGTEGPERYDGAFVTANLFDILGVRPMLGSGFRPGDDNPGAPLTTVLGYETWATRYGSDPGVIGQTVKVNGEQATIVGVMDKGFMFPTEQQLWLVRRDQRGDNPVRGDGPWHRIVGRLKQGVTIDQAELDMAMIAERLAETYVESNEGVGVVFSTFMEDDTGPELVAVFSAMQVATIFVLIIACANVANLLLARATLRTKEAALRSALGASTFRVVLPFFTEALILSLGGALAGIGIAYYGVSLFDAATQGVGKPYYMEFALDLPILGYVLAVTALTAVVAGAAPAFHIARTDVNGTLKDESKGSSGPRGGRLSRALVTAEIALSCALLVGAGLMTKSIVKLRNYEFAFNTENVFTARIGLFETVYPDRETRSRFFRSLSQRLEAVPGAQSVALTDQLPAVGGSSSRIALEGETYETDQDYPRVRVAAVTPDFFATFGVDLLQGRNFTLQDDAEAQEVVIVNRPFVERFFPGQDPLGRRFQEGTDGDEEWKTIVGVVPNMKMEGFDPDAASGAGFYVPLDQRDLRFVSIAVQTRDNNAIALAPAVREAVRSLDTDLPIYNVTTLGGAIREATWFYNVFGTLFIIFGAAALFMASVGLYGVLAFSVSRRIKEMGIRMALGAKARDVIKLVLTQGAWQLGLGLTAGLALAFGVSRVVGFVMFEVEPRDPAVFGSIAFVIAAVSFVASLVPARRATGVDPMIALRHD